MYFRPDVAISRKTGARVPIWTPLNTSLAPHTKQDDGFLTTGVDRHIRDFDHRLVDLALQFNADLDHRKTLRQDSAVFALACVMNDPLSDVPFYRPGGKAVDYGDVKFDLDMESEEIPPVAPGEVVALGVQDPQDERNLLIGHCLVRASTDYDIQALYFSKLGVDGRVVLSTYESMAQFYGTERAGQVIGLHMRDYREPEASVQS